MNPIRDRISPQTAQNLLARAAQLDAQKHQEYVPTELMQAANEAGISTDSLQEALHQVQAEQAQSQTRYRQFRLVLGSGLAGAAIALLGFAAYATMHRQPTPETALSANHPIVAPDAPTSDGYPSTYTGTVQQYLLNPEGAVDGLLLKNGLQIKMPPHLSQAITQLVKSGSEVSVTGTGGTSTRFGQEVRATQITNRQSQQTVSVQPPTNPRPAPPAATDYTNLSTGETVQQWLVGHRGELNGAVLTSGIEVKFPPHVGEQLLSLIQGGDRIQVQGFGSRNSYGQVIEATSLSLNGKTVAIAPPGKARGKA